MSTDSRVIDPETLAELPVGEAGEIVTHGSEVLQGYWKRPEATAEARGLHRDRRQALFPHR